MGREGRNAEDSLQNNHADGFVLQKTWYGIMTYRIQRRQRNWGILGYPDSAVFQLFFRW